MNEGVHMMSELNYRRAEGIDEILSTYTRKGEVFDMKMDLYHEELLSQVADDLVKHQIIRGSGPTSADSLLPGADMDEYLLHYESIFMEIAINRIFPEEHKRTIETTFRHYKADNHQAIRQRLIDELKEIGLIY